MQGKTQFSLENVRGRRQMRKERKAGRDQAVKNMGGGRLEARDMERGEAKLKSTERLRSVLYLT